jgi:hypothetical protein
LSLVDYEAERPTNPVDLIELIAVQNDWTFERSNEDEITVSITGVWAEYQVSFSWMDELEALHLACAFDLKLPEARKAEVVRLLALVNEQLWIGHFDLWQDEGTIMYRHALLLSGGAETNDEQIGALIRHALDACERYFQAFQFVVWGGKGAKEAIEAALIETMGEA